MPSPEVQYWLKLVHNRPERQTGRYWLERTMVNDPHRLRGDGTAFFRPAYRPSDRLVVYLTEIGRCVAAFEVLARPDFDPNRAEKEVRVGDGESWGWVTDARPIAACDAASGPSVAVAKIERRTLGRAARRRITADQFHALLEAIREANGPGRHTP